MVAYPEEMAVWRSRALWLCSGFQSRSKGTVALVEELLQFLNGDTRQHTLVHFCKSTPAGPCCSSDTDAFNKLASMLTAFLAKGFPVPLLYRMKHYSGAASFIRVGCCLHNLLPRILEELRSNPKDRPGSQLSEAIDVLLEGTGMGNNEAHFQKLLGELLNEDANYAARNGVRQQMVLREMSDRQFHQSSIIIDMLVQKMEHCSNFFLKRTKMLYDLQYLSSAHPNHVALRKDLKESCLRAISGKLGWELVQDLLAILQGGVKHSMSMGLDGSQTQLNLIFQMVVYAMTDVHRRFILDFDAPPFSLLRLASADEPTFVTVLTLNSPQHCSTVMVARMANLMTVAQMRFNHCWKRFVCGFPSLRILWRFCMVKCSGH